MIEQSDDDDGGPTSTTEQSSETLPDPTVPDPTVNPTMTEPPVDDDGPASSTSTGGSSSTGDPTSGGLIEGSSSSGGFGSSSSGGFGSSSSGGESSSSTGSTDSDTASFIVDPSETQGSQECSSFEQDCPEGEKCNPWSNSGGGAWNALGCFPVDPMPGQPGDPCQVEGSGTSGIDTCAVGAMCWDVDSETNTGECIALCSGTPDDPTCGPPDTICVTSNDDVLNLCLPSCDPLMANCPGSQACYPIDNLFTCAPDGSGEMGQYGDPCEFINACDPGLACVGGEVDSCPAGSAGCCSPFCDLNGVSPCQGSDECVAWFDEGSAPAGLEDVGICTEP